MGDLIFLKLGGSLITDKTVPRFAQREIIARLAVEIGEALQANPQLKLVLGHGSGSFGHVPAKKYGTRQGVTTPEQWRGFAEVWRDARALNQIVVDILLETGLPVIAMPPSASVIAADGQVESWQTGPLQAALDHHLIPVINGDTIFDTVRGGTILSTEDLFFALARQLKPRQILLAGYEDGVCRNFPACAEIISEITPETYPAVRAHLTGSAAVDVTGGMAQKVDSMLALCAEIPGLQAAIFSGREPGLVRSALLGRPGGTVIHA